MFDHRFSCAFLTSAAMHGVLLGLLAVFALPPAAEEAPPILVVSQWASYEPLETTQFEFALPSGSEWEAPLTPEPAAVALGRITPPQATDPSAGLAEASWGLGLPTGLLGAGGGGGGHGEPGATFFGTTVPGSRFVYVVDASGSMAGRKFRKAKREVFRSVTNLRPDQEFFVIFFGYGTYPMYFPQPYPNLMPSVPEEWRRLKRWIGKVEPRMQSRTDGKQAVLMALELEPDAIYLLTDGAFTDDTLVTLLALDTNPIPIHTIAFGSRAAVAELRQIAEHHQGTHRYAR